MGVWGWILLYVLLFSLLQLFIYRYLRSDDDAPLFRSTPPTRDLAPVEEARESEERPTSEDSSTVNCPRCGTGNDPHYTYCWNCVNPMAAH